MELFNLLDKAIPVFGQTYDIALDWIGKFIQILVSGVGVGMGIILFSLILKVIVLPFDVYQRRAMRKQNIKMEEQKERMEKLQKQYANNQEMYNQKLMEMYKENGISMFSSCLPMIISMVIFFVAIGAFNAYSQYSNVQNYNELVKAYNAKIESYCPDLETAPLAFTTDENNVAKIIVKGGENDYVYYSVNAGQYTATNDEAIVREYIKNATNKEYFVDTAKAQTIAEVNTAIQAGTAADEAAYNYFISEAQNAVVAAYEGTVSANTDFLWIKNIWATDAAHIHPMGTFSEFEAGLKTSGACGGCAGGRNIFDVNGEKVVYGELQEKTGTRAYTENAYNLITGKLTTQKEEANGYYILIALSIATILLQQFITMRSQKAQNKYSTVDGQGASQQKMTMIMMTGMFAIFSFMYSSAFSLYMIVSNVFSMISTLVINKCVDVNMAKKSAKEAKVKLDNRGLSRIEAAKNAGKESAKESREKKVEKTAETTEKEEEIPENK